VKETDVLGQLKELPPIIIDVDEIEKIPKHLRVNHVLKNYLRGGDTIAKTSLLKYFVNSVVGIVENINTNPVLSAYLGLFRAGMSILELNTIFNNIIRPIDNNIHIMNKGDIEVELVTSIFGGIDCYSHYEELEFEHNIIKDSIFDLNADICNKYNIKVIYREIIKTDHGNNKIIAIEYKSNKMAFIEEEMKGLYNSFKLITIFEKSVWKSSPDSRTIVINEMLSDLNDIMLSIFYDKIDTANNYVIIDEDGFHIKPKKHVEEKIFNVDYQGIVSSMGFCLDNGLRRGYLLVGCPGVGKSMTIHKMMNNFPQVPTFIVKNEMLDSARNISHVFKSVKSFKAILIIDDFDGLDVSSKNGITNQFLFQMDINGEFKGIIVGALNNPALVNYALMNRPGRFDEVHLMRIPSTIEEVEYVLKNAIEKNNVKSDLDNVNHELIVKFYEKCISNDFTHARISGIVEYCACHYEELNYETLSTSLDKLVEFSNNANLYFDGNKLRPKSENDIPKPSIANIGVDECTKYATIQASSSYYDNDVTVPVPCDGTPDISYRR